MFENAFQKTFASVWEKVLILPVCLHVLLNFFLILSKTSLELVVLAALKISDSYLEKKILMGYCILLRKSSFLLKSWMKNWLFSISIHISKNDPSLLITFSFLSTSSGEHLFTTTIKLSKIKLWSKIYDPFSKEWS